MKPDRRWRVLTVVALTAIAGGTLVYLLPERAREVAPVITSGQTPSSTAAPPRDDAELHKRFQQAAVMLHAGQYEYALTALERVLELAPRLPEAHVNAGFALVELRRPAQAEQHFRTAIDLRPGQANAYYGLALVREAIGDYAGALGAMRTFAHLSPPETPHLRRAWAAIWEWQDRRDATDAQKPHAKGDADEAADGVNS